MKKPKCATGTDWERVKREAAADAPIDDQSGPYDPSALRHIAEAQGMTAVASRAELKVLR